LKTGVIVIATGLTDTCPHHCTERPQKETSDNPALEGGMSTGPHGVDACGSDADGLRLRRENDLGWGNLEHSALRAVEAGPAETYPLAVLQRLEHFLAIAN
jgi:hypothetical protein